MPAASESDETHIRCIGLPPTEGRLASFSCALTAEQTKPRTVYVEVTSTASDVLEHGFTEKHAVMVVRWALLRFGVGDRGDQLRDGDELRVSARGVHHWRGETRIGVVKQPLPEGIG